MPPGGTPHPHRIGGRGGEGSIDRIDVDTASGEIRIHNARKASAKTASGNVRADEIGEAIKAKRVG